MQTNCLGDIDVVILAGGFGKRLKRELNGKPKLLAPICGKPYFEFVLKWLSFFGVRRIILSLGYLAQEIENYVSSIFIEGLEIICAIEPEPLGTAGGLAFASSHIKSDVALVMNGDSFVDADLCSLLDIHKACAFQATIVCTRVANSDRYGSVQINETGEVVSFQEKAETGSSGLINAGIYVFSRSMIRQIQRIKCGSLEDDVFENLPLGSLNSYSGSFEFLDIGTPEDYARATEMFQPFLRRWSRAAL